MSYPTAKPFQMAFNTGLYTGGSCPDNTDLQVIIIPAGREVEIQSFFGNVNTATAGAGWIELVKADNTVLCKFATNGATGVKSTVNSDGVTATTFPIRVAPQSTTAPSVLKFRSDQVLASCSFNALAMISGL